jgi:hypothetical protein
MKTRYLLLTIILLVSNIAVGQRRVCYTYDENGNRLQRKLEIISLKASHVIDGIKQIEDNETNAGEGIILFPNPFDSSIRLHFDGYSDNGRKSAILFNMAGIVLKRYENLSEENLLMLDGIGEGSYVLRIVVGSKVFVYKIIKSE